MTSPEQATLPTPAVLHQLPRRITEKAAIVTARPTTTIPPDSHAVRNALISGSVAGIASTVSFYPFDVLRTKMQSAAAVETATVSSSSKVPPRLAVVHRGPIHTLFHTLQHGGVRALYTGLALPLTAQAVYKATVFSVNKISSKVLLEWKTQEHRKLGILQKPVLTGADQFACGFIGGAVNALLFVTPVEFVRNQLIAQHSRQAHGLSSSYLYSGPRDVIRHTISSNGLLGLWRGASMAVARDAFGCGCFFYTFHYLKRTLPENQPSSTILAGAASGLAFWVTALPLDTVKTWVQNGSATSGSEAIMESISQYGLASTCARLCRGWQVAFGRGMPAAAVTIGTYEWTYQHLEQL